VAQLGVEINEERAGSGAGERGDCGFLGFDFRRIRSRRGVWRPHHTPKRKKRTAVVRKLKEVFRRGHSQPVERIIPVITPILRGWGNYFRIGSSGPCFDFIRQWVAQKIRRHVRRAKKRHGFGWQSGSLRGVSEELGLF
jgi:RNA-directed DNA polymerase